MGGFVLLERIRIWRHLERLISGLVEKGQVVVDIGAGPCHTYGEIRKHKGDHFQYIGIEPSEKTLEKIRIKALEPASCVRAIAEAIPLEDSVADRVLVFATLDHCYDLVKALGEIRRIMKPGAIMLATLTNEKSWFVIPFNMAGIKREKHDHHYFLGAKDLVDMVEKASFEIVDSFTLQYLPLTVIPFGFRQSGALHRIALRVLDEIDMLGKRLARHAGRHTIVICKKPE